MPREVDGIRTDVKQMVIELQSARVLLRPGRQVDGAECETLSGGISMGPSRAVRMEPPEVAEPGEYTFVGTLGAIVRDREAGRPMALTNFHVACVNDEWSSGDRMVQPGRPDGGDPATDEFGSLARAQLSENIDGAVVLLDEDRPWEAAVVGVGPVAGAAEAATQMPVQKRGRTTGHTFGTVASTEATLSLDYGDGLGTRTLRRQIRISTDTARSARFSDGGDSGSVVLDTGGNVVGLLFAGDTEGSTTFANPIQAVLDELAVDLEVDAPALPQTPSTPETGGCTTNVFIENVTITVHH
ncbi:hypothetical protein AB0K08_15490 [Citricoccus sp. NPDC055426]|uniref:hypothetical protein n=1 Tax=Citricoccus sp. NPDC055426 TaxID=3155536 RepID=UPI003426B6EE